MAAQVFWAVFYSSRWPSQIGQTADFEGAAIPPPIFSMTTTYLVNSTLTSARTPAQGCRKVIKFGGGTSNWWAKNRGYQ